MRISLDTNVWIFGLLEQDANCVTIIKNLDRFQVIVPNQIRKELTSNLSNLVLQRFYKIIKQFDIELNYEKVPDVYIHMFYAKGLKKGDAIIGGFAEWKEIDTIVSDNRDFLRGLSAEHYFEVMSPQEFCEQFGL